jgi:ABC-type sugar transport system substrate-binding protein
MPKFNCRMLLAAVLVAAVAVVMLVGCPKPQPTGEPAPPAMTPETSNAAEATPAAGGPTIKVCISSRPGQLNLDERERGYRETIKKEFPQIDVIQTIDDETKYSVGQQKASAVLSAHPDLAGFAGVNAASGPGIAAAVTAAGKSGQVIVVAMDADSAILDQIQKGVITASVAQRQYFMTYIGVKYLYGLVHDHFRKPGDTSKGSLPEVPQIIDTGTVEVNAQNVAQFRTPSQGAKEELDAKHPDWKKLLADRKQGEARADEEYVAIGISTGVEYWNAAKAGLDDVAKELGVKGTFTGPQDQNPEQQANTMDQIIARKPAGILIAPGNPDTLLPYINKAIEAGIPVICFDTDAPKSKRIAYFGTENYQAGCTGARILAKALLAKAGAK